MPSNLYRLDEYYNVVGLIWIWIIRTKIFTMEWKYEFDISKITNEWWSEEWSEAITTTKNQQKAQMKETNSYGVWEKENAIRSQWAIYREYNLKKIMMAYMRFSRATMTKNKLICVWILSLCWLRFFFLIFFSLLHNTSIDSKK